MRPHGQIDVSAAIRTAAGASLLVVAGSDRGIVAGKEGRRGHAGNTDLFRLLGENARFDEFHLGKSLRQLPWIPDLAPYSGILNLVTDPDQNPRTLDNLRKLLRAYRGRVINRPEAVLRSGRDQVARLLAGIPGLRVPRAIRLRAGKPGIAARAIERAGMRYPIILRRAGTHTGKIVGLFDSADELAAGLTEAGDHIATEFVDFKCPDGLYRKYRVYFFGKRVIFRHMLISDEWNVHVSVRSRFMGSRPSLLEEEAKIMARPEGAFPPAVREAFAGVRERMDLDYFGMDFGIDPEGHAVLFEANATMSFFPVDYPIYPYLKRCIEPAEQAFRAMVREACEPPATRQEIS